MPDSLAALEARRREILEQFAQLGDMRAGSLSENYRRCGKARCACASSEHAGHGPYFAFTRKTRGKTRTRNFRAGPKLEGLRRQVEEYRRMRQLTHELVQVNELICDARGTAEPESGGKKKRRRSSGKKSAGK
jgi:hypothetical protein